MKHTLFTFLIPGVLCATVLCARGMSQEANEPKSETQEVEAGADRSPRDRPMRQADRNRYRQRQVELKDPAGFAVGQDQPVFSGPQVGEALPPFKATGLYGPMQGKDFDAIELAQGKPQVLILSDESGVGVRGMFQFSRFTSTVAKKSKTGLHVSALFLGDDPATIAEFASRFGPRLGEQVNAIGVSPDGRDGPGSYGLNRNVSQTIIFAKEGKVMRNFAFPQGMLYADPHVLGALAEVVGEERETVQAWLNEMVSEGDRMAARGEGAGNRDSAGTGDRRAALRERLGKFVDAGKLTRDEAIELFQVAFPGTAERRDP